MRGKKLFHPVCIALSGLLCISGCATQTIPLQSEAKNVNLISVNTQGAFVPSAACHLKGQVAAKTTLPYAPKTLEISENESNAVKNQVIKLGANTVYISHNVIVHDEENYTYAHLLKGDAYLCYPVEAMK